MENGSTHQSAMTGRQSHSATSLVPGHAAGKVVFSETPLSFLMGVDLKTGNIMDLHHPLNGTCLSGCILVIPCGRGSCSASGAIVELLLNGCAPAALIFQQPEPLLTLGVLIAKEMFQLSIPVLMVNDTAVWNMLSQADTANISSGTMEVVLKHGGSSQSDLTPCEQRSLELSSADRAALNGANGEAARIAMEMIASYAAIQGATSLIDVKQVHIDACIFVGQNSVLIPEKLVSLDAKLAVPTTCNSLSADMQRWRELGADPDLSIAASKIGELYMAMGAQQSFTCAPYLLDTQPEKGEQIGWAESNAVVFANSVLGARTQKYPDYLDVFIAITGRAPLAGCHLDAGRVPTMVIAVPPILEYDDIFFPLLGYYIGHLVGSRIPFITGLEDMKPSIADLKGFGAGFATSSSSPMFHIRGITPEAEDHNSIAAQLPCIATRPDELLSTWKRLSSARNTSVDIIALGNPHFALSEFEQLALLCKDRKKTSNVNFMVTTNRDVYLKALKRGFLDQLKLFGARIITDTCWCMIEEPVISPEAKTIMTNSSKYAHYGPGMVKKDFYFASLEVCVETACTGRIPADRKPPFLEK